MFFSTIVRMFESGNVCVTGLRGTGKDVLTGNVIARRGLPYVSNLDYGGKHYDLDYKAINCGGNTYKRLIDRKINYYKYPYEYGTDIYISDAGVYYPSQYCSDLNRSYPELPTFMALSRQIGRCNVHVNVQNLNRCWDKIREQSDMYIRCRWCRFIGNIVVQTVTIYDTYQSCVDRVKPFRVNAPLISSGLTKTMVNLQRDTYQQRYGYVRNGILIYKNRSQHDTFYFGHLFEGGEKI